MDKFSINDLSDINFETEYKTALTTTKINII